MGLLNKDSLPPRLNDPENWKGTDDDNFLMRWRIHVKHWFAFSSLPEKQGIDLSLVFFPLWWFQLPILIIPVFRKWRRVPTVLIALKGEGPWRVESTGGPTVALNGMANPMILPRLETSQMSVMTTFYLSRIQKWTRWHVALHWPLLITFSFYWKAADVLKHDDESDRSKKVISGYKGWHYDADGIFWGDGAALGNFK